MTAMKTLHAIPIFLCILLTFSACSTTVYRDDKTATELVACVEQAVPTESGYRSVEPDYLSPSAFGEDIDLIQTHVTDWAIALSDRSDAHPDEILVFHVPGGAPDTLRAVTDAVVRYKERLKQRLGDYYRMYAPEELDKLENASVKVCGNYVLMTILDEQQTRAAHTSFETALK